jgi:hypothetical protein
MSSPTSALTEITKIGNYVIPVFGAVVTVAIALGPIGKETTKGSTIIVSFAIYTLLAAFVSYLHRLSYKRCRRAQEESGEEPYNLPLYAVIIFMVFHFILICALSWFLHTHGIL